MSSPTEFLSMFSLQGKRALVTGGGGVLCRVIGRGLARAGAEVFLADIRGDAAQEVADGLKKEGLNAHALQLDVLNADSLRKAAKELEAGGGIDILLNGAGGNQKAATVSPEVSFFDLPEEALRRVIDLNLFGIIKPSQVFGKMMAGNRDGGAILNISSISTRRPLTRVVGYSAAKSAVESYTRWLATYLATECSPTLRVNALAPGFFLTEQNRFLLTDEKSGELTARGKAIISHTPQGRIGDPEELIGAVVWLCSDAARFVTGTVVTVDGGFTAYAGV